MGFSVGSRLRWVSTRRRRSLLETGLYNFHSWALLAVVIVAIVTGFGRSYSNRGV